MKSINVKKTLLFNFLLIIFINSTLAQNDTLKRQRSYYYNYYKKDTSVFESRKIRIIYTLINTEYTERNFRKKGDSVFTDTNIYSRLCILDSFSNNIICVSTIPLDNIIIDDKRELIIGLSRSIASPFKLVLYNFKGQLLFKKSIWHEELILTKKEYKVFCDSFPTINKYVIENNQIFEMNNLYYIDLQYFSMFIEPDYSKLNGLLKTSPYFPHLNYGGTCWTNTHMFKKLNNFYSKTDPFYDFDMKGDKVIGVILNDEYGGKVKIPVMLK